MTVFYCGGAEMGFVHYTMAILLATTLSAQGCSAKNKDDPNDMRMITGIVKVTGNAPFTRLILVPGGGNPDTVKRDHVYLISGGLAKELMAHYQYKTVTLKGRPCTSPTPEFKNCFEPLEIMQTEK
jgi:hypothetical protein